MSKTVAVLRLVSLALSFVFGIVALSVDINALAKSNSQKSTLRKDVPSGVTVNIDTQDVFSSGVVVTVVCGLIGLTSLLALVHSFFRSLTSPFHRRTVPLFGAHLLTFLTIWLFATIIPFTDFVANRQAKISASLGGVPLSQTIIQATEQQLGFTPVYHKLGYLRTGAILPWFAFLFGATSAALSYVYARQAATANHSTSSAGYVNEKHAGASPGTQQV
ncbi:uncharacterized protein FIBRA_03852 [Fibroporia radiculosa]|uniref:MARVEL domain-containing protein n=1 Tax=Fibroporia radiculosa TaxID=599839 RepID=J4GNQ2_9APHY|nr:uncharacterized protein FIBRA_03852 [Fibroporia radiculosa]CCM01785.1 predicted protein [Fibroporia radiculosa]